MSENSNSLQNSLAGLQKTGISKWSPIDIEEVLLAIDKVRKSIDPEPKTYPVSALQPGRVLAERIVGREDVPKYRTATANGYACCATDGNIVRKIVGISTPETPYRLTLQRGECVQLTTDAIVPNGADSVIELDKTVVVPSDDPNEVLVKFMINAFPGQNISKPGSEMIMSELVLDYGCELNAAEIGVLNSLGIQNVEIFRKPKVCVISIGNELIESYVQNVPMGCFRDSNRPQLLALFRQQGFKSIDAGLICNSIHEIKNAILTASQFANVIVTSGGANQHESDFLKDVLERGLNFKVTFGRVWIKQGTHCGFAHGIIDNKPIVIFALPGYPPDTLTCAHLFVSPFLRGLAGHSKTNSTILKVKVAENIETDDCPSYLRAWLERRPGEILPIANITGTQMSSRLQSLVAAEVLLILPPKHLKHAIITGEVVDAMIISGL